MFVCSVLCSAPIGHSIYHQYLFSPGGVLAIPGAYASYRLCPFLWETCCWWSFWNFSQLSIIFGKIFGATLPQNKCVCGELQIIQFALNPLFPSWLIRKYLTWYWELNWPENVCVSYHISNIFYINVPITHIMHAVKLKNMYMTWHHYKKIF